MSNLEENKRSSSFFLPAVVSPSSVDGSLTLLVRLSALGVSSFVLSAGHINSYNSAVYQVCWTKRELQVVMNGKILHILVSHMMLWTVENCTNQKKLDSRTCLGTTLSHIPIICGRGFNKSHRFVINPKDQRLILKMGFHLAGIVKAILTWFGRNTTRIWRITYTRGACG